MPTLQPSSKAETSKRGILRKRYIVAVLATISAIATVVGGKNSDLLISVIQTIVSTVTGF